MCSLIADSDTGVDDNNIDDLITDNDGKKENPRHDNAPVDCRNGKEPGSSSDDDDDEASATTSSIAPAAALVHAQDDGSAAGSSAALVSGSFQGPLAATAPADEGGTSLTSGGSMAGVDMNCSEQSFQRGGVKTLVKTLTL